MEPVIYILIGIVVGMLLEFLAIVAGMSWIKGQQQAMLKATPIAKKTEPVGIQLKEDVKETAEEVVASAPVVAEPVITDKHLPSAQFGQRYWYFVQGHEKPYQTLKEALSLFPVEYAKCKDRKPQWGELSTGIQSVIRREEIVRSK